MMNHEIAKTAPTWVKGPLSQHYFDEEWGNVPLTQEAIFEHLCLFIFQTGLTWEVVLKYRNGLAELLFNYDLEKIVTADNQHYQDALDGNGPDIIKNKKKLDACLNNAWALFNQNIDVAQLFAEEYPLPVTIAGGYEDLPQVTERTKDIATTLKNCGLIFIGATAIGSLAQALGLIRLAA